MPKGVTVMAVGPRPLTPHRYNEEKRSYHEDDGTRWSMNAAGRRSPPIPRDKPPSRGSGDPLMSELLPPTPRPSVEELSQQRAAAEARLARTPARHVRVLSKL